LGAERPIEVGHITEPAIKRDVEHRASFERQADRRFAETCAQDVLMRRHAGEVFERPQEMIRAEACFPRKPTESQVGVWTLVYHPKHSCHPGFSIPGGSDSRRHTRRQARRCGRQVHAEFLPADVRGLKHTHRRGRDHRRQCGERRHPRHAEGHATGAAAGISQ
jgi:hypothetical protein